MIDRRSRALGVCPTCDGAGYRAGAYDVPCAQCRGSRVVPATDDYREKVEVEIELPKFPSSLRLRGAKLASLPVADLPDNEAQRLAQKVGEAFLEHCRSLRRAREQAYAEAAE